MQLHYSRLSEKDRRHYAALESLKLGRGGTTYISKILGVDRKTILQGRKELTDDLLVFIPLIAVWKSQGHPDKEIGTF